MTKAQITLAAFAMMAVAYGAAVDMEPGRAVQESTPQACDAGDECQDDVTTFLQLHTHVAAAEARTGFSAEDEANLGAGCGEYACNAGYCHKWLTQLGANIATGDFAGQEIPAQSFSNKISGTCTEVYRVIDEHSPTPMIKMFERKSEKGIHTFGRLGAKSKEEVCRTCTLKGAFHERVTTKTQDQGPWRGLSDSNFFTDKDMVEAARLSTHLFRDLNEMKGAVEEMPAQGYLGDCWVVASIAAFALWPKQARMLFVQQEAIDGTYYIRLWTQTHGWATIPVAEDLPLNTQQDQVKYMQKPKKEGTWPLLVEKAFGKLGTTQWNKKNNMAGIEGGHNSYALQTLTGHISEQFSVTKLKHVPVIGGLFRNKWYHSFVDNGKYQETAEVTMDVMWQRVLAVYNENGLLGAGCCQPQLKKSRVMPTADRQHTGITVEETAQELEAGRIPFGIVNGHAYTILAVKEILPNGYLDVCYEKRSFTIPEFRNKKTGEIRPETTVESKSVVSDSMCKGGGEGNFELQQELVGDQGDLQQPLRLIKIRNPHGRSKRWTGAFGSTDRTTWNTMPKLQDALNPVMGDAGDGTWWMKFADFVQLFDQIYFNNLNMANFKVPPEECNTNWGGSNLGLTRLQWVQDAINEETCGQCVFKASTKLADKYCPGTSVSEVRQYARGMFSKKGKLCCVVPEIEEVHAVPLLQPNPQLQPADRQSAEIGGALIPPASSQSVQRSRQSIRSSAALPVFGSSNTGFIPDDVEQIDQNNQLLVQQIGQELDDWNGLPLVPLGEEDDGLLGQIHRMNQQEEQHNPTKKRRTDLGGFNPQAQGQLHQAPGIEEESKEPQQMRQNHASASPAKSVSTGVESPQFGGGAQREPKMEHGGYRARPQLD